MLAARELRQASQQPIRPSSASSRGVRPFGRVSEGRDAAAWDDVTASDEHTHTPAHRPTTRHATITEDLLRALCGPALERVERVCVCIDTTDGPADVLGHALPRLTHLDLSGSILPSLRDLGTGLRCLRVLNVSACGLSSLDAVTHMHTLTHLAAADNPIDDCTPLAMHESLEALDLSRTRVADDASLASLGTCPRLTSLALSHTHTHAQPDYLTRIATHMPQLKRLDGRAFSSSAILLLRPSDAACPRSEVASALSLSTHTHTTTHTHTSAHTLTLDADDDSGRDAASTEIGGDSMSSEPDPRRPVRPGTAPVRVTATYTLGVMRRDAHSGSIRGGIELEVAGEDGAASHLTHGEGADVFAGSAALMMRRRRGSAAPSASPNDSSFDSSSVFDVTPSVASGFPRDVQASVAALAVSAASACGGVAVRARPQTANGAVGRAPAGVASPTRHVSTAVRREAVRSLAAHYELQQQHARVCESTDTARGVLAPRIHDGVASFTLPSVCDFSDEDATSSDVEAPLILDDCDSVCGLSAEHSHLHTHTSGPAASRPAPVPAPTPAYTGPVIDCGASCALQLSDAELVRLLRHRPKDVSQLCTRYAFAAFFAGFPRHRMRVLLRTAYSDMPPSERETRTQKRLQMLEGVLDE